MPREKDPFRKFVVLQNDDKNMWKCKFCEGSFRGGATRIKAHLGGVRGRGIQGCEIVKDDVRAEARKALMPEKVMDLSIRGVSEQRIEGNFGAALTSTSDPPYVEGGTNLQSAQDLNEGAPTGSHPSKGDNLEERRVLKRKLKLLHSKEANIRGELEIAASRFQKKLRMEVVNWLARAEKCRNDFRSDEVASEDCYQQVDILLQKAKDLMRQGLCEAKEAKVSKLLERKMVGKAFQRNTVKILEYLEGNQVSRLGIYGMGGVGKTTIMVHIHNILLEKANYGNVLWITVSLGFNSEKLQDCIWKELGLGRLKENDVKKRAAMLSGCLMKRGKSKIILDDVWECLDLEEVGIPVRADALKLVLTTRSFDVCCQMHCQETIRIEPLSQEEAECLFLEELGSKAALNMETKAVVKSIVRICAGLPLGVITMAQRMRGVTDVFEWKDFLVQLRESDMGPMERKMKLLKVLELSYKGLDDYEVQQCFLSCALYPKDELIDKFELIELFIDQGIFGGLKGDPIW